MSSTTNPTSEAHSSLGVFASVVGVTIPAAFLTMMADSIGKDPYGPILYLSVVVGPSLLGFLAYAIGLRIDPNVPRSALGPAVVVSLCASLLAFVLSLCLL